MPVPPVRVMPGGFCNRVRRFTISILKDNSAPIAGSMIAGRARGGHRGATDRLWTIVRTRLVRWDDRAMDASDLAQETLLYASRTFDRFRGATEVELMAWLRGIHRHLAVDARRHDGARKR